MEKLQPPGCKMGVSFKDHRFTPRWHYAHPELHSPYHTRNHSATFVTLRTWRDALSQVHRHNWEKWALVKVQYPLEPGCAEQVPGEIPEEI